METINWKTATFALHQLFLDEFSEQQQRVKFLQSELEKKTDALARRGVENGNLEDRVKALQLNVETRHKDYDELQRAYGLHKEVASRNYEAWQAELSHWQNTPHPYSPVDFAEGDGECCRLCGAIPPKEGSGSLDADGWLCHGSWVCPVCDETEAGGLAMSISQLMAEVGKLQNDLSASEAVRRSAREEISRLDRRVAGVQAEKKALQTEVAAQQAEIDSLQKDLDRHHLLLQKESKAAVKASVELQEGDKRSRERISQLLVKVGNLRDERHQACIERESAKAELLRLRKIIGKFCRGCGEVGCLDCPLSFGKEEASD